MENSRKKIGNDCEKKLALLLKQKGYWCHVFEYNKNGQPCDIVAFNGNKSFLIDVKHCCSTRFPLSRIEANQRTSFEYALRCGIRNVGFAVWFDVCESFKWLPYEKVATDVASVRFDELEDFENAC